MVSSKDNRRYSRFPISLGICYQTHCPESEGLHQGQGIIRNISLSGILFEVDDNPALQLGQSLSLNIAAPMLFLDSDDNPYLTAIGEVVRLEPPGFANPNYAVAVRFSKNLSFAPLDHAEFSLCGNEPAEPGGEVNGQPPTFIEPSPLISRDMKALQSPEVLSSVRAVGLSHLKGF